MRRAAKVDANQAEIVRTLRQLGIAVCEIGKPVDLLCHFRGQNHLVEIKNRDGRDTLTKDQLDFIARWPGTVHVVHNSDEAIRAICGDKVLD